MADTFAARAASPADAEAIARIYNEGIADRVGTFETEARSADDVLGWIEAGYPLVVAEDEAGELGAWASAPPYRAHRPAYAGVARHRDAATGSSSAASSRRTRRRSGSAARSAFARSGRTAATRSWTASGATS